MRFFRKRDGLEGATRKQVSPSMSFAWLKKLLLESIPAVRLHKTGIMILLFFSLLSLRAQVDKENKQAGIVRARALLGLAHNTEWVEPAIKDDSDTLVIGILGRDAPRFDFDDKSLKKPFGRWRKVDVRYLKNIQEARKCQILYVSLQEADNWKQRVKDLDNPKILTISEADKFIDNGGMVHLELQQVGLEADGPKYKPRPHFHPEAQNTKYFRIDARILDIDKKT